MAINPECALWIPHIQILFFFFGHIEHHDLSSLSRNQTQAFYIGSEVLATVSPRKSLTVVFS